MDIKDFEEKTVDTKQIFDGKVVKLRVEDVTLPNGAAAKRELIAHPGGAGMIAVDEDKNVLMVRQYRIAARQMMLEIPAGKLEYGEDPQECAEREITEETGYQAGKVVKLGSYYATPGYCEEVLSLYLGTELTWRGQNLDEGEFLQVEKFKLDDLYDMVMNNEIVDAKTAIAILKAKAILG